MKVKEKKGITLIALIITIIILLILAVVTIMAVNGDGIISKAKQAKADYENAQVEEQGVLDKYLAEMESLTGDNITGGNNTTPEVPDVEEDNKEPDEEKNPNIATYIEENVPIPVGFKYVEGTKDTGVVVENEADGSQFVWVPVTITIASYGLGTTDSREPDIVSKYDNNSTYLNRINNILGTTYSNSDEFLTDLQNDFNAMAESVNKNHGFYVGRYETSLNSGVAQVVKGVTSAAGESANSWYGLYAYQKEYSTSSVQGSMIWGSQYNAMMAWMGDSANTTIGNNRNTTRLTGTVETDKINNVYDLCGNSFEWTLEANSTDGRVYRGGFYNLDRAPGERINNGYPVNSEKNVGSRLALYIK